MVRPFYKYTFGEKVLTVLAVIAFFCLVGAGLLVVGLFLPVVLKAMLGDAGAPTWLVFTAVFIVPTVISAAVQSVFQRHRAKVDNWLDDDTNREIG